MKRLLLSAAFLLCAWPALAQLPPSGGVKVTDGTTTVPAQTLNFSAGCVVSAGNNGTANAACAGGGGNITPVIITGSSSAATANATNINAAIQALGALSGGIVYLPCGNIYVGASIDNNVANVIVQGCGGPNNTAPHYGTGSLSTPATLITPTFAGEVLRHRTPYNASSKINMGGGFLYLSVVDNSVATTLLDIDSVAQGQYDLNLTASTATQAVLAQACITTTNLNDACDVRGGNQKFMILLPTGGTSDGYVATGSSNANVSFNNISLTIRNNGSGSPAKFISADNNQIVINQISNVGTALTFYCPTAANPVGGDQNTLTYLTGAVQIVAQGTDTGGCTGSVHNNIQRLDTANTTPVPAAGTGSTWGYTTDNPTVSIAADQVLGAVSGTTPGLSFQGATTTGFYESSGPQVNVLIGGAFAGEWSASSFEATGNAATYVANFQSTHSCSAANNTVTYRALANNAGAASKIYSFINTLTSVCTAGSEAGELDLGVISGASFPAVLKITPTSVAVANSASFATPGAVTMPGLAASSAAQTGTLCWTTGTGNITVDTTTTCLLSSLRFKHDILPLPSDLSLREVMALKPKSFTYNADLKISGRQLGLIAEDVAKVEPRLVRYDEDGKPLAVKYQEGIALLVGAIQQQQREIEALRARLDGR